MSTPSLAFMSHTPDIQTSNLNGMSTQSESFEDIGSRPNARVEDDFHFCNQQPSKFLFESKISGNKLTVSDSIDNIGKHFQAPDSAIYLSTCVVCHNYTFATNMLGFDSIFHALDSFDYKWSSSRDAFPLNPQKIQSSSLNR